MTRRPYFKQALILLSSLIFFSLFNLWLMPTPMGERLRSFVSHLFKHLIP